MESLMRRVLGHPGCDAACVLAVGQCEPGASCEPHVHHVEFCRFVLNVCALVVANNICHLV